MLPPELNATPGTTARPADKGATAAGPDVTAVRMAVNGLAALSGMRRKAAREVVLAYVSTGRVPAGVPLDGWAHWLRSPTTGRGDPTGETARRRADQNKGLSKRLQRVEAIRGGGRVG